MHSRHGTQKMLVLRTQLCLHVNGSRGADDTHLHGNPLQQGVLLDLGNVPDCQTNLKHNTALNHDQRNGSRQNALTISLDAVRVAWNSPAGPLNTLLPHPTESCEACISINSDGHGGGSSIASVIVKS